MITSYEQTPPSAFLPFVPFVAHGTDRALSMVTMSRGKMTHSPSAVIQFLTAPAGEKSSICSPPCSARLSPD